MPKVRAVDDMNETDLRAELVSLLAKLGLYDSLGLVGCRNYCQYLVVRCMLPLTCILREVIPHSPRHVRAFLQLHLDARQ
jgi:hypothetical protein